MEVNRPVKKSGSTTRRYVQSTTDDVVVSTVSFQHSEMPAGPYREGTIASLESMAPNAHHATRPTEMKLMAMAPEDGMRPERHKDYKGRIRTWPGILLTAVIIGAACAFITLGAIQAHKNQLDRKTKFATGQYNQRKIKDGLNSSGDLIEDDGQIGNPKKYPNMGCELPNYLSKNGQIIARSKNGTEVPVGIKGVNWFGMETGVRVPFGLWENQENGTSVYEIASFLSRNKFNSVRLPVGIENILSDKPPSKDLVNLATNRAMNLTSYMTTLQSIIEALAYRQITVMISVHTLSNKNSGGAWYSEDLGVSEDDFLKAIDILTSNLCSPKYWNILGLDLKNEPHECKWGSGTPDWQKGATLIGNRMLKGCKNWMAFVEGIAGQGTITLNGKKSGYFDWWGGGLENAGKYPIELDEPDKLVWAPHYYNTGVDPAWYLYDGGKKAPDRSLKDYVELDDETLSKNVEATMDVMFGYLNKDRKYAMVMGEFAGLYATDKHEKKTTKRTTDFTIQAMLKEQYAGGYMWSLNPESSYQFNPADTFGTFTEGLLLDDWLTPNKEFLEGMAALDGLPDLKPFPCFPAKSAE